MAMLQEKLRRIFEKGLPTALLEVALIFFGITLALGFENWNFERAERLEERALLKELQSNLKENVAELEAGIEFDSHTISGFETVLAYLSEKRPYSEDLSESFANLENWDSPYLTSSAYETLKSRGLDLISDSVLRAEIVRLYDRVYAHLTQDHDRAEWINYEISMLPLMLANIEERSSHNAEPIDYDALLEDRHFRIALLSSLALRRQGLQLKQDAVDATKRLIDSISLTNPG